METLVICVCTCQRPKMLSRCLSSLLNQALLPDWQVVYVVVDNELEPNNEHVVRSFTSKTSHKIAYVHQPRRGIASARNAALDEALRHKPDWICFFDDDQYAKDNAIISAYTLAKRFNADVISMQLQYIFQKPSCIKRKKSMLQHDGKILERCSTGGVMFTSFLVKEDGLSLRFNEEYGLWHGEDMEFFHLAYLEGAKIIYSQEAIVYEEVVPDRTTFKHVILQTYSWKFADMQRMMAYSSRQMIRHYVFKAVIKFIIALMQICLSPVYLCLGLSVFNIKLRRAVKRATLLVAVVGFFWGKKPAYYKKISGY